MRPLDPRLLRVASAARWLLVGSAAVVVLQSAAIVVFAIAAGAAIASVVQGEPPTQTAIVAAACAIVVRAVTGWVDSALAARGSIQVRSQLRARGVERLGAVGTDAPLATATALGRGLEALDGYLGGFLPQLVRTMVAVPIIVVAVGSLDLFSGIAIAVTLPLVPVFMALIGMATERAQRQQWRGIEQLASALLDTVEGMATLKIFRRDRRARELVAARSREHGERTMHVLRISFLSSLVLELASSIAIAIVAVSVGVRLIEGEIPLDVAFGVLILVPDAFLPVRLVGSAFHAATEGVEATKRVLDLIDSTPPQAELRGAEGPGLQIVALDSGRGSPLTASIPRGTIAVLRGPSGVGKTSALLALLGSVPASGAVGLDGRPLRPADIAWIPQRAADAVVAGTVESNIALGGSGQHVALAAAHAGVDVPLDTPVDPATGAARTLSGGQLQRVVVARGIRRCLDGAAVLLADEPTSALDTEHEQRVIDAFRALAADGAIVLVTSHRRAVIDAADIVLELAAEVVA